ncbi:MAG: heavy-metal-associated domain-containing protein, partial [bacterium]
MNSPSKSPAGDARGMEAESSSVILSVGGMSCASCAARVEKRLKAVPGVQKASVNFAAQKAYVKLAPGFGDSLSLEEAVAKAGYSARVYHPDAKN